MDTIELVSYNVNGIRSAISKGLIDWIQQTNFDIYLFQEIKANEADIPKELFEAIGYECHFFSAQKKGYSGVAVFSKTKPDAVVSGNGHKESDDEGRVIQLDFGDVRLINAYFPSGTSGDERQQFKYVWLDEFHKYLTKLRKTHPKIILCGDYNIAHNEIDIHDPKGNKNSSGFLPQEREWMTKFLASGWIDTFREFHTEPHRYSWWSQRFPSVRLNNKGWRIDYITVTEPLKKQLVDADIYPDVKHSDHCPVYLEIKQ